LFDKNYCYFLLPAGVAAVVPDAMPQCALPAEVTHFIFPSARYETAQFSDVGGQGNLTENTGW